MKGRGRKSFTEGSFKSILTGKNRNFRVKVEIPGCLLDIFPQCKNFGIMLRGTSQALLDI